MALFSFSHPQLLIFLFGIPLIFFIHFYSLGNRKKKALKFANFEAIARIDGIDFFSKNIVLLVFNVVIFTCIVFAASGLTLHTTAKASEFSFVIAIDSSKSMEATDILPDRISAAKETASGFVDEAPIDTSIGVISFSGSSRIESDMSESKGELKAAIGKIQLTDYGGTDIYEAVLTGSNMLRNENHRAIVLLSDGQINVNTVEDAIEYANDHDVIVHSIAIGTLEGGETEFGTSRLDEDSLKSISYETQGAFFNTTNKGELASAFAHIFEETDRKVSIELFDYLLIIAMLLILAEFFLSNTRYGNLI